MNEIDIINFLIDDERFGNVVNVSHLEICGIYSNTSIAMDLIVELFDKFNHEIYFMKSEKEFFSVHFTRKNR